MTWTQFLSEYEATIDTTVRSLETGEPLDERVLAPFQAPQGLGPLPTDLVPEVARIVSKNQELQNRLTSALEEVGQELGAVKRETAAVSGYGLAAGAKVSKYFDQPA